jgi:hypothetical protein
MGSWNENCAASGISLHGNCRVVLVPTIKNSTDDFEDSWHPYYALPRLRGHYDDCGRIHFDPHDEWNGRVAHLLRFDVDDAFSMLAVDGHTVELSDNLRVGRMWFHADVYDALTDGTGDTGWSSDCWEKYRHFKTMLGCRHDDAPILEQMFEDLPSWRPMVEELARLRHGMFICGRAFSGRFVHFSQFGDYTEHQRFLDLFATVNRSISREGEE